MSIHSPSFTQPQCSSPFSPEPATGPYPGPVIVVHTVTLSVQDYANACTYLRTRQRPVLKRNLFSSSRFIIRTLRIPVLQYFCSMPYLAVFDQSVIIVLGTTKGKKKCNVLPIICREGAEGECRYTSSLSLISTLDGVGG